MRKNNMEKRDTEEVEFTTGNLILLILGIMAFAVVTALQGAFEIMQVSP